MTDKKALTTFADVQEALETYVNTYGYPVDEAPHGRMWKRGATMDEQYKNFITQDAITGFKILEVGSSRTSNIILALRGLPPFDGSTFPRMPVGAGAPNRPFLDAFTIAAISDWIDKGAKQ
ncbi:MAG: hypothetical protein WCC64_18710 [Aliidongia sp.]